MKEFKQVQMMTTSILADISQVSDLQSEILSTGAEGEQVPKDQELADTSAKIQKAIKETGDFVTEYSTSEKKK